MRNHLIKAAKLVFISLAMLAFSGGVNAHSMVAQHGTLNFVGKHVYVMLSFPLSSINKIDEDNDGHISMIEFNHQRKRISTQVKESIFLLYDKNKAQIEGLLLSPSISHSQHQEHVDQVVITARYSLPTPTTKVSFNIELFGAVKEEQVYEITAFNKKLALTHQFEINSMSRSANVFDQIKGE